MRKFVSVLGCGLLLLILLSVLGCDSSKKKGGEFGLPFEEMEDLRELVEALAQPNNYTAKVAVQGKDGNYPGEMVVNQEQGSRLKLERNPVFQLLLNNQQVVKESETSEIFDFKSSELRWLRIGELFVLEPNLLKLLKTDFTFKMASPLKGKVFVTAYPKNKDAKIKLVSFKILTDPMRIQSVDVLLRIGTLVCHADYSEYIEFKGANLATKIEVSWLVDWKPREGVFVLSDIK